MTKVVINTCFGGYSLSPAAINRMAELGCPEAIEERDTPPYDGEFHYDWRQFGSHLFSESKHRSHPILVQVVEELGSEAAEHIQAGVVCASFNAG